MRVILWIITALVCLVPIAYFAFSYIYSPSKDQYNAKMSFVTIANNYVSGNDIDKSLIKGNQEDSAYLDIFADYLNNRLHVSRELLNRKNSLAILVQPRNLAVSQSIDVSLEKAEDYNKDLNNLYNERENLIKDVSTRMDSLDKKKMKTFDPVGFSESLRDGQPERQSEFQAYIGLYQYVKAILDFCKTRIGYYQLDNANNSIVFTRPEDQAYYNQLVSGKDQYIKVIEDAVEKHNSDDRKSINGVNR